MNKKKMLTLDDLQSFCEQNKFSHFNSKESGYKLRVQVPAVFKKLESDETTLFADIKIMHEGKNRNGSALSEKAANHCMKTLAYKPLLANFTDVNGEWDFTSHDFEVKEDENGEEYVEYYEKQIGCFTADKPYRKYDEEYDRTFIYGRVAIPREYTRAAEIIERKGGTFVSAELEILEMSYNNKESFLSLDDAILVGCTCLGVDPDNNGEPVQPGMVSAQISLESFSENNNSLFTSELLEELKKFNKNFETIQFSNNNGKEEESMDQNNTELLEEEIQEEATETEVEEATEATEEFSENSEDETPSEEKTEVMEEETSEEAEETEKFEETESDEGETKDDPEAEAEEEIKEDEDADEGEKFSLTCPDGTVRTFGMSATDLLNSLFTLVNDTYGELDNDFYMVDADLDESTVTMMGWSGTNYRQSYKKRKDNISLEGERVQVYAHYLSADEEKILEESKKNFAEVSEKLAKYEAEPEKMEILESDDYENISETEEFAKLKEQENHFDLSVDDVKAKADELLLNYAKGHQLNFAANEEKKTKKVAMKGLLSGTGNRKGRYGNLFSK